MRAAALATFVVPGPPDVHLTLLRKRSASPGSSGRWVGFGRALNVAGEFSRSTARCELSTAVEGPGYHTEI